MEKCHSNKPVRIQLSRKAGFNLQEVSRKINGLSAVIVSRPSKFGNPFRIGDNYGAGLIDAKTAVALFQFDPSCAPILEAAKKELRGKNLACWCRLGQACHADVLLEISNS